MDAGLLDLGNGFGVAGTLCLAVPTVKASIAIFKLNRHNEEARRLQGGLRALVAFQRRFMLDMKDAWSALDAVLLVAGVVLTLLSYALPLYVSLSTPRSPAERPAQQGAAWGIAPPLAQRANA